MAELTPLAEEADSLRSRVAEAHHHADEVERAFEALSARSWRDNEEAAKVRKERDELLQTMERFHSEHGVAREERDQALQERDQACQERDDAQLKVGSLQAELGIAMTQKLEAESVSTGLAVDLAKARKNL